MQRTIILGSMYSTLKRDIFDTTEYLAYVTYVGKHGFTLTTADGCKIPISYSGKSKCKFIQYPINPETGKSCTLEEVKIYYPEYFI